MISVFFNETAVGAGVVVYFKGICCIIVSENMWAEGKVYSVICFIPASVVRNEKVLL